MPSVLHLAELEIPLHSPFSTAVGAVGTRRVVLVGLEEDGLVGWGEAAPYPGISAESAGDVWGRAAEITDPAETTDLLTLDAALDQARFDLAARLSDVPLWQYLGGESRPVPVSVALGLADDPDTTARAARQAVDAGFRRIKVKIAPGRDLEQIAAVRAAAPAAAVSADANGAYTIDDPLFDRLDEWELAYVEQPLSPRHLTEHAMLRERLDTPVCLDETMHSPGSARDALSTGALDIACLKVGLLGPSATAGLATTAHEAGLGVKLGGLVETSVGRSHTLALGTLRAIDHTDLTPATWYLDRDVTEAGWSIVDGAIAPTAEPGIGFDVDAVQLAGLVDRTRTVPLRTG